MFLFHYDIQNVAAAAAAAGFRTLSFSNQILDSIIYSIEVN